MDFSPVSLLAFAFASPWLLGGLALGAVPIVIHLLYKRRYREVPWAAMRFLIEATRKNARRLRLEQLLLLAVRVLILVLLALALAQPYVESFGSFFRDGAPVHRIIVVDASFSMAFRPAEQSRFERAKALARQIVAESRPGDALNLVRISALSPFAVVREPAYRTDQVLEEIDRLRQTDEKGDLPAALEQVAELLTQAPDLRRKEVLLISDFQRATWADDRLPQIRRQIQEISEKARLVLLDVARERAPNLAVTDLSVEEPFLTVGRPVHLQATLQNFGGPDQPEQLVELHIDGKLVATEQLDLPSGGEARAAFTHTFDTSGEHRLEVRISGDALDVDNRRWLSLPVRDELNVLLVDGRPAGRPAESATHYLKTVLAPSAGNQTWTGITQPRVIHDGELPTTDLSRYDCVFLCNVGLLTEREAQLLQAYVESGGGLVICLGDQVRPENYNQVLHRDGKGLLPARLGNRKGNARNPQEAFEFDPGDLSHPIVNQFKGNPGTGLESTMAFEYVEATLPENSTAEVVLRFASGDPAIIDAAVGRGRVILLTTSVDHRWGPWPLQASFPPIVHETVRYAVAGRWTERQRAVGEPLARSYPVRAFELTAAIKRPDADEQPIIVSDAGEFASLAYEETDRAGIYELVLESPLNRSELFAVNVDPAESDLSRVEQEELQADVLPGIRFLYETEWHPVRGESGSAAGERGGLSRWLLWAVVCLVFVEQLMAWRFFYGLALLSAIVTAAFVGQAFAIGPVFGAALVIVLAAIVAGAGILARRRGYIPVRRPQRTGRKATVN